MHKLAHLTLLSISYKLGLIKPLSPPYQYNIEPTNICNFKCVFCPQSDTINRDGRKRGYLTPEKLKLFLNQVRDINPGNKNFSLTLAGEPSLNKTLPELIRLINAEGFFPRFSSNAKKLTPDFINKLVAAGSFWASIDFASEARYFDNVRGKKGDFEIVLENLRYMVDIVRRNPKIKMELVDVSHYSGADPETSLRNMRNLFTPGLPENITSWSREFHNFGGHLPMNNKGNYRLCPYPWTAFTVTWDGNVVPCCRDTRAKTVLGNVFRQTIPEIWHGEEYKKLRASLVRKEISKIEACKDCDLPWSSGSARWGVKYVLSSLLRR